MKHQNHGSDNPTCVENGIQQGIMLEGIVTDWILEVCEDQQQCQPEVFSFSYKLHGSVKADSLHRVLHS